MIYFTSDLHLGHRGIITMRDRPFADVSEMNRTLITNFKEEMEIPYECSGGEMIIDGVMCKYVAKQID